MNRIKYFINKGNGDKVVIKEDFYFVLLVENEKGQKYLTYPSRLIKFNKLIYILKGVKNKLWKKI